MTTDTHAPADTRTMGIVHSALRRDLERTRMVLDERPHPDEQRREALADHLLWMMHFLHLHHSGEDAGLWPLIRRRNPAAGTLLDQMDADHQRIATAITGLEAAARDYRDDSNARERLLTALAALANELLPHLRREELDMMPVVAATITDAEYRAVEQEYFVKPKGFRELATEAHWVLDGLPAEGREVIVRVVPAVPRFVILHGFAGSYRRKRQLLWGDGPAAALPSLELTATEELSVMGTLARYGRNEVHTAAPPEAVGRIIADVTRVGEWSHECRGARWVHRATVAKPGARFRGTNRSGRLLWSRSNVITAVREQRELAWRTCGLWGAMDSTQWHIELEPIGGGTRIVQTYDVVRVAPGLDRIYWQIVKAHRDRRDALTDDLHRLAALAATEAQPTPPPRSRMAEKGRAPTDIQEIR